MKKSPILIIGKNAKTGSRVNQRLQALGYATRAVSRSTHPQRSTGITKQHGGRP